MSFNPLDAARDEGFALGQSAQIETLRDRFAMAAMPAVISVCGKDTRGEGVTHSQHFAMKAYEIADAMMEARK